jgi:hypothetical protein
MDSIDFRVGEFSLLGLTKKQAESKFSFQDETLHKAFVTITGEIYNCYSLVLFPLYKYHYLLPSSYSKYLTSLSLKDIYYKVLVPVLLSIRLLENWESVLLDYSEVAPYLFSQIQENINHLQVN